MRKRLLVIATGVALATGLLITQPASASCEQLSGEESNPRGHGNEAVGVYVEDVPADYTLLGQNNHTDRAWVEVQDDGRHAPVAVEAGWEGRQYLYEDVHGAPLPVSQVLFLGFCTDSAGDELP